MKPEYLLWSKLVRGIERDLNEIKWLLSIPQLLDGEINNVLDSLGVAEKESYLLS